MEEQEFFYDEQGCIFRTPAGGKFWSVSFWIPEEKKEYRRSLKTKDKALALQKAKDEFLTIQGKIKSGVRVWDITVSELIEEYLKHQEKEYEAGKKTKGRVGTIRSQLKHFSEFVDSKTRVSEIKDEDFLDYISFRRKKEPNVQNVTLINEKSTFRNLLSFCQRKGYLSRERDWSFGTIKKELVRRNDISLDDWRRMARYMIHWDKKESDPKIKEQKIFVRSFIMLLCHTGIRFGEARRIQWKDIETYYEEELNQKTKERKRVRNIHIHLSKEKTKNHKAIRPEDLGKEVVALANLQGGRILLGVEDDGTITGIQNRGRSSTEEWVTLVGTLVKRRRWRARPASISVRKIASSG